jgi:hypothetical protein
LVVEKKEEEVELIQIPNSKRLNEKDKSAKEGKPSPISKHIA